MTPAQTEPQPSGSRFKRITKRTWKPVFIIVVGLIVIHTIATMLLGQRFEADVRALKAQGEPVSAAELGVPKVPGDQNAAVVYAKASRLIEDQDRKYKNSYEDLYNVGCKRVVWPAAKRAALLYEGAASLAREALTRPKCQFRMNWAAKYDFTAPRSSNIHELTQVLVSLAILDAHEGRPNEAYAKIINAFRVARVTKDEPSIMSTYEAMSCATMANSGLRRVMRYSQPNSSQVLILNKLLRETDYRPEWVNALRGERARALSVFREVLSGDAPWLYSRNSFIAAFQRAGYMVWRPVFYVDGRYYIKSAAMVIANAKLPSRLDKQPSKSDDGDKLIPRYAMLTRLTLITNVYGSVKIDETCVQTALTQILLAALKYKSSHGAYPETISQVMNTLDGIPKDPFNGKDFVYRRTPKGFLAYSIGKDLKDDDGIPVRSGKDYDKGGDIVLNWEQ